MGKGEMDIQLRPAHPNSVGLLGCKRTYGTVSRIPWHHAGFWGKTAQVDPAALYAHITDLSGSLALKGPAAPCDGPIKRRLKRDT